MILFDIDSVYLITIKLDGNILNYTAKIIFEDEIFFRFIDKFDKEYTYNKSVILKSEKREVY